jgi:hypothetical protein
MTARHLLDMHVRRITGFDIRLAGIWKALPALDIYAAEISAALGISEKALRRCRDIADVLDIIPTRANRPAGPANHPVMAM